MTPKVDEIYPEIKCLEFGYLSDNEKLRLIDTFHECYFDTAQSVETFSVEFQRVVSHILSGDVPVALEFLEDFQERIYDVLDDNRKEKYKKFI